jgi:hypothetical protein
MCASKDLNMKTPLKHAKNGGFFEKWEKTEAAALNLTGASLRHPFN